MNIALTREQKAAQRRLRAYRLVGDRMDSAFDMLARADAARSSVSSAMGSVSMSGGRRDKMADALIMLDEACDRIRELSSVFCSRMEEVERAISDVQASDEVAGRVLREIYIKGSTPTDAAAEIGCSRATVYDSLRRGLDMVYGMTGGEI